MSEPPAPTLGPEGIPLPTQAPSGSQQDDGPGRYRDEGRVAQGGMSEVRRVWDHRFGMHVAMKRLRPELLDSDEALARFHAEVQITARLQHPGVVAVYDQGVHPSGAPWFTMTLVRGQTFGELLASEARDAGSRRRLVEILVRACEAVAYAHSQGVLHRDLKPDNLMVGAFGEVLVMDWGLARAVDLPDAGAHARHVLALDGGATQLGEVLGTPVYMPPEQAAGDLERLVPASDVYALGSVLHQLLTGTTPLTGTARGVWRRLLGPEIPLFGVGEEGLPVELVQICRRALAWDPADRFVDAGALSEALRGWLDGAQRRAKALAILETAATLRPEIEALRALAAQKRSHAAMTLAPLLPHSPVERKAPAWALEDEAEAAERDAVLQELRWRQVVGTALEQVPELPEAHAVLADHYAERLVSAEQQGLGQDAARFEALLADHDHGAHAALLTGVGAVTLITDPPGATVRLFEFVERTRRLEPVFRRELGSTPLVHVPLERGSWLLELHAPGCEVVRYPVSLERGQAWEGVRPGDSAPTVVRLPRQGELGPHECCVPAGWFIAGGDPLAIDALPRQRVWVDGFVIGRTSVSVGALRRVLQARVDQGLDVDDLLPFADTARTRPLMQVRSGRVVSMPSPEGLWADVWAAAGLTWKGAVWAAGALSGGLPNELQWAKAARGVDGRVLPWGTQMEPTWAAVLGRDAGVPRPVAVGSMPLDRSPYGVLDLAGGVRDWCANVWTADGPVGPAGLPRDPASVPDSGYRSARGGAWASTLRLSRMATRFANRPQQRFNMLGLRLVRPAPG